MDHYYLTTPIYYVNDVPHLGHAYTTMTADALARFHRMRGVPTRLLTGTDEHGQKIEEAATKRGLTPQALVDEVAPRFAECWKALGIAVDDFIRTTEPRHKRVVAELWKRIADAGDLYLAAYEGWYCVGCEAFYTESQLDKDGEAWSCRTHKRPVTWVAKERSWFFKMSKYQDQLLAHIERHPDFIRPEGYRNEVVAFVKSGLRDLSVSRTSFAWGIPVPADDPDGLKHVVYVWLDALVNYMSALGDIGSEGYQKWWPASCHLIGKDILRFHAVYWPCFLMSAGLPLPRTIFAHGWWTVRGEKISKSMPATRVDPVALATDLGEGSSHPAVGVDALRYFLLREVPLGNDGDFTYESLLARFNADLANDLGNLVNRVLDMVGKFGAGGAAIKRSPALAATGPHAALAEVATSAARDAAMQLEEYAPSRALESIWKLVSQANGYIAATEPWRLAKAGNAEELGHVLHTMLASLSWIQRMIAPVMPATAQIIGSWLGLSAADAVPTWPEDDSFPGALPAMTPGQGAVLFPRMDGKRMEALLTKWIPPELRVADAAVEAAKAAKAEKPGKAAKAKAKAEAEAAPEATADGGSNGVLTFDEFKKAELRVGQIVAAQPVPKAKKLLQLTVDLGEPTPRTVVAGIAEAYSPEALIGRKVILVANLAPAEIRGIRSEGMILAAGDDAILGLSALDRDVPVGTRVR